MDVVNNNFVAIILWYHPNLVGVPLILPQESSNLCMWLTYNSVLNSQMLVNCFILLFICLGIWGIKQNLLITLVYLRDKKTQVGNQKLGPWCLVPLLLYYQIQRSIIYTHILNDYSKNFHSLRRNWSRNRVFG